MNRSELQLLAEERVRDTQALLAAGRWSGAYYLAGYAVECALKSCVLTHVERTGIIFQDKGYAGRCWTHNLEELVQLAGLKEARGVEISANPARAPNWSLVKDWKETSRYEIKTQSDAEKLFDAVNDNANGVLPWIKTHW